MKITIKTMALGALIISFTSCASQKNQSSNNEQPRMSQQGGGGQQGGRQQGPPSYDQLLSEMDANEDGMLAKDEVSGPLANDFSKIDTNEDGFLSESEIKNAPRPQRGGGPR
ncbi:hypothetical protein KO507_09085 [Gilvimarinus agarilyticus]|uniref:EF hand n=1 Tax=Reichenbachiella agariperforans TaxID=156994 RepID=A0A1M6LY03_REIAG|nr:MULTISPECIES: hypothetical protein [Reichenbachiella]MBU2885913.1 hypothetical protein [Gilvimarinus agarilyticus]MBU2914096.1 hypothetical protein [Reichenbachiella agariperforans]SHJ76062.1 EF hand [Reichenbachiella agariperforans]